MERVILLKTQLAEAAKFARSTRIAHRRLAAILLDNFIEIQLSTLIKQIFLADWAYYKREKKYSESTRIKILYSYEELLKACVNESIISTDELRMLNFCHNVRNNLYHKAGEEEILIRIAIIMLHQIIVKYQPKWASARGITVYDGVTVDPYTTNESKFNMFSGNSKNDWEEFLAMHFNCIDKRSKSASRLISDFLIDKIKKAKDALKFVNKEYVIFFPGTTDWDFNRLVFHYSFLNTNEIELKKIKELVDKNEKDRIFDELIKKHRAKWTYKKPERLHILEKSFRKLATLGVEQCLEKFMSYKEETFMLHNAIAHAAGDLDSAIQDALDYMRGK